MRLIASAALAIVFCLGAARAATLTGAAIFSTDSSGAPLGQLWNTLGNDVNWNLYLQDSSGWVNSGNGAATSIDIPLSNGSNTWSLYSQWAFGSIAYMGIDLFFDGATTPGISVFAPVGGGPVLPISSSTTVYGLGGDHAPSAGTDTYVGPGGIIVQLTGFSIALSDGSVVSLFDNTPGVNPNYTGLLELQQVPEPGTLPLAGGALLALFATIRRRSRRSE
jgi:hypothetical protein